MSSKYKQHNLASVEPGAMIDQIQSLVESMQAQRRIIRDEIWAMQDDMENKHSLYWPDEKLQLYKEAHQALNEAVQALMLVADYHLLD